MTQNSDDYYPSIDLESLCELIRNSGKVIDEFKVGDTTVFTLGEKVSIAKRTILIRWVGDNCYDFNQATSLAYKYKLMPALLQWFEEHKLWKDGAYIVNQ